MRTTGTTYEERRAKRLAKKRRKEKLAKRRKDMIKDLIFTAAIILFVIGFIYLILCSIDIGTMHLDTRGPVTIFKGSDILLKLGEAIYNAIHAFIDTLRA